MFVLSHVNFRKSVLNHVNFKSVFLKKAYGTIKIIFKHLLGNQCNESIVPLQLQFGKQWELFLDTNFSIDEKSCHLLVEIE